MPTLIKPKNPYLGQSQKPKSGWKIKWGVLFFWLIVIGGAVYFFMFSSFFKISEVIIEGNKNVSEDKIKPIIEKYVAEEDNLFRFPVEAVEKEISDQFWEIDKINVTRGVPGAIKAEVIEREGFLVWQTNNKNFLVDRKGIAFRETDDTFSLPVVTDQKNDKVELGEKILTSEFVRFITKINKNFKNKTKIKIETIIVPESTFELHVTTAKGWRVMFDTTRDADEQINALVKVLPHIKKKIKQYVDLRTENWIYYK